MTFTPRQIKTALRQGYFTRPERKEFIKLLQENVISQTTFLTTIKRIQTSSRFIDIYTATLLLGIEAGLSLGRKNVKKEGA